jgi:carbohydrate-selective porin OprB
VRFEDPEAAGLALALDGQEYLGHQLKVKAGKRAVNDRLGVWNMAFMTFHILGMSPSQLTNSYFSEGWLNHQPDDVPQ